MKRRALLLLLVLAGCRFGNAETGDHRERIVSLAKQYTEILFALGAQQDLVAVDLSSTYPPEAQKLPTVGYHRALSAEGIVAVKPTLILHDDNVGPEQVMRQLEQLHIPTKVFAAKGETIESTKQLIAEMGAWFHKQQRAAELNQKLDADMSRALSAAAPGRRPRVLVVHFGRAMNVYLVMTNSGVAGKMVQWAGGEMAVSGERGMVQLSPEIVAKADPDVLLLTDYGYDRLGSPEKIGEALPGIGSTRAVKEGRVYRVEEHDLAYLGPRTGENVLALQGLLRAGKAAR
ncbi:MAG TPA: ABC transporter substrate-binding protein [Myxococcales bacterium]|nr:ABC transporter substrate-binding protein [Myxococcales bacterium]